MKNKIHKIFLALFFACLMLSTKQVTNAYAANIDNSVDGSVIELAVGETFCLTTETLKNECRIRLDYGGDLNTINSIKYSTLDIFKDIINVDKKGNIKGKNPGVALAYIDIDYPTTTLKQNENRTQRIPISFIVKKNEKPTYTNEPTEYQLFDRLIKPDMDDIVKVYSCFQWVVNDFRYSFDINSLTRGVCANYSGKLGDILKKLKERYNINIEIFYTADNNHAWNLIKLSDGKYYVADATWKTLLMSPYLAPETGYYKGFKPSEFSKKNYDYCTQVVEYFGGDEDWYNRWIDMVGEDIFWIAEVPYVISYNHEESIYIHYMENKYGKSFYENNDENEDEEYEYEDEDKEYY